MDRQQINLAFVFDSKQQATGRRVYTRPGRVVFMADTVQLFRQMPLSDEELACLLRSETTSKSPVCFFPSQLPPPGQKYTNKQNLECEHLAYILPVFSIPTRKNGINKWTLGALKKGLSALGSHTGLDHHQTVCVLDSLAKEMKDHMVNNVDILVDEGSAILFVAWQPWMFCRPGFGPLFRKSPVKEQLSVLDLHSYWDVAGILKDVFGIDMGRRAPGAWTGPDMARISLDIMAGMSLDKNERTLRST